MNLISYRPLTGSYAIFGGASEMKAVARLCLNIGPDAQMPGRHCNNIVCFLGHVNLFTPIKLLLLVNI